MAWPGWPRLLNHPSERLRAVTMRHWSTAPDAVLWQCLSIRACSRKGTVLIELCKMGAHFACARCLVRRTSICFEPCYSAFARCTPAPHFCLYGFCFTSPLLFFQFVPSRLTVRSESARHDPSLWPDPSQLGVTFIRVRLGPIRVWPFPGPEPPAVRRRSARRAAWRAGRVRLRLLTPQPAG
jgi:hypothetical protein